MTCLKPLHCGAVVASDSPARSGMVDMHVSIPFIAGQWSLLLNGTPDATRPARVSIPFIAGQWSLLAEGEGYHYALLQSQSPSLRGSGRFT